MQQVSEGGRSGLLGSSSHLSREPDVQMDKCLGVISRLSPAPFSSLHLRAMFVLLCLLGELCVSSKLSSLCMPGDVFALLCFILKDYLHSSLQHFWGTGDGYEPWASGLPKPVLTLVRTRNNCYGWELEWEHLRAPGFTIFSYFWKLARNPE